jgi:photosystem II stability/assembly factor-like uncharacterized protein
MGKVFSLVFSCVLLLNCSSQYQDGFVTGRNLEPVQTLQEEHKQDREHITLTKIAPAYEPGKFAFDGIALLENNKILSIGYDGENLRNIRISTDKGQTWETKSLTQYPYAFPDSMYFIDDQHGWIGGGMGVFFTTDGGDTWRMAKLERYLRWTELSFYSLQIGYLAGKHNVKGEMRGEIWNTKDGGKSWKRSYISKRWDSPFSIVAISDDIAVAVFNDSHLIRTSDGGKSWHHIKTYDYRTFKLALDKKGRLWSVGHDGNLFFSSDNGSTWQRPQKVPADNESTNWSDISFANKNLGFIVGDKGAFAMTKDGGETWERIESNVAENLWDVLTNQSFGIVVGSKNVYRFEF